MEEYIKPLNIWQYYALNVKGEIEVFRSALRSFHPEASFRGEHKVPTSEELLEIVSRGVFREENGARFSLKIRPQTVEAIISSGVHSEQLYEDCLNVINMS